MAEPAMPTGYGTFCWNQLNTPDLSRSQAFYQDLFDWRLASETVAGTPMLLISRGPDMIGNFMDMPAGLQAPSHWLSYVWVEDLEAVVARAEARGARIVVPVTQVTEAGRIAVFLDPRGCLLGIYSTADLKDSRPPSGPGTFCWFECLTRDLEGQQAFYGALFGWTFKVMDTPGGHEYHLIHRGTDQVGGMMAIGGEGWGEVPDHWMTYVAVADIEATVARVGELGGKVCVPVTEIGIGRFAVLVDPNGATFSCFQGA